MKRPVLLLFAAALTGCQGSASAQAFERYVDCSDRMRTGDALEVARSCWVPRRIPELQEENAATFLMSTRALAMTLLDFEEVVAPTTSDEETENEAIELQIVGHLDNLPTAIRVGMEQQEGVWYIASESFDVKSQAVLTGEEEPALHFEIQEQGRVVLDSNNGVWQSSSAGGFPTLMLGPFFEGPTLQIDNLRTSTPPQDVVGIRDTNVLQSNSDIIGVDYRTPDGPARIEGGQLTIDRVEEGRLSGRLTLVITTGRAGPTERVDVVVSFDNLPVR